MKKAVEYFGVVWVVGFVPYGCYEWYTYSGVYRLIAEWQLDMLGKYDPRLTALVTLVALMMPALGLGLLDPRVWRNIAAVRSGLPPRPSPFVRAILSPPLFMLTVSVVMFAIAAGAGLYGYSYSQAAANAAFEAFDLSSSKTPPSRHVVMTGVAHPAYQVDFGDNRTVDHYVPVTATDWRPDDPLVYFVKTPVENYAPPESGESYYKFSRQTPPFPVTSRGMLVESGLPGAVAEFYRKNGVAIAPAPVLLNPSPGKQYLHAAAICSAGGVLTLLLAAFVEFRRRRKVKIDEYLQVRP
jgi:hypothetical protein